MLKSLADLFGVPFCRDKGKHLVAVLAGSAIPSLSEATLVSFFKTIPLVGQVFGALPVSGGSRNLCPGQSLYPALCVRRDFPEF